MSNPINTTTFGQLITGTLIAALIVAAGVFAFNHFSDPYSTVSYPTATAAQKADLLELAEAVDELSVAHGNPETFAPYTEPGYRVAYEDFIEDQDGDVRISAETNNEGYMLTIITTTNNMSVFGLTYDSFTKSFSPSLEEAEKLHTRAASM